MALDRRGGWDNSSLVRPRRQAPRSARPSRSREQRGALRRRPLPGDSDRWLNPSLGQPVGGTREIPRADRDPLLVSFSPIHPGSIRGRASPRDLQPRWTRLYPPNRCARRLCGMHVDSGVYDVATGRQPASPPLRPGGVILSAGFAPDGRNPCARQFASARWSSSVPEAAGGEGRVTRWDWQSGRMIGPPTVVSDDPWEVCCSPDGKQIAVITALSRLVLIESASGKVLSERETGLKPGSVATWGKMGARVCFNPEGKVLTRLGVHGLQVGSCEGRDEGSLDAIERFPFGFLLGDGRWTVKGTAICDTHTEKLIAGLPAHPDAVLASRFSPDGTRVLTGCRDGAGRLWDWRTGRLVCPAASYTHARCSTSASRRTHGNFLATASTDGTARVWNRSPGRPVTPPLPRGCPCTPGRSRSHPTAAGSQ